MPPTCGVQATSRRCAAASCSAGRSSTPPSTAASCSCRQAALRCRRCWGHCAVLCCALCLAVLCVLCSALPCSAVACRTLPLCLAMPRHAAPAPRRVQMEGAGSVVMVNLLIAFVEIAGRLDDRSSDGLLLKLMYGERARDAITAARVGAGRGAGGEVAGGWLVGPLPSVADTRVPRRRVAGCCMLFAWDRLPLPEHTTNTQHSGPHRCTSPPHALHTHAAHRRLPARRTRMRSACLRCSWG